MDNDILYRLTAIDPKSVDPMILLDILEARDEIKRLRKGKEAITNLLLYDNKVCDEYRAEIKRLREALRYEENRFNRIGTHSEGCHSWGPSHYECAMREIERLQKALQFYAKNHENPNDGPWGVSSTDFGNVARKTLGENG